MSDYASIVLHLNTDYAEIPRKELPTVVKTSYNPVLEEISALENVEIPFNITGHSIEYLSKHFPETIEKIKELVKDGILELLLTGFSHPILPLLPLQRAYSQLEGHMKIIKKLFSVTPVGFWPPELAVSPFILEIARELGIKWVTVDYEHFILSQTFGNEYNPFEKREKTMTEILADAFWSAGLSRILRYWKAKNQMVSKLALKENTLNTCLTSNNNSIHCYLSSSAWTVATQLVISKSVPSFFYNEKKLLKAITRSTATLLPIYSSDIEFFGYRGIGMNPIPPSQLSRFIKTLQKKGIKITTPSKMSEDKWDPHPSFISTGSWSPDKSLKIWTESEDNKELTRRMNQIYSELQFRKWDKELIENLEKDLRIAENSDARGWSPIPERKQEAYVAIQIIEDKLREKSL